MHESMRQPVSELGAMLAGMEPVLHDGVWVYALVPDTVDAGALPFVALVREAEGMTVVLAEEAAQAAGLTVRFRAAWITLTVHSDLAGVGLTAAFSRVLGEAGISANVVAGYHHDHLFVPYEQGPQALEALRALQASARVR